MKPNSLVLVALTVPLWFSTTAHAASPDTIRTLLTTKRCPKCDLVDAGLVYARLIGADLRGANLVRANLSRADLTGADLSGANLSGASLVGANLTGANLTGANLLGADLRDTYLAGAKFDGATLQATNLRRTVGLQSGVGSYEDFYRWGMEDYRSDNVPGAIENYNQALGLNPKFAPAYVGRAASLLKQGRSAEAIADAQLASQLFKEQGNMQSHETSEQFIKAVIEAEKIAKERRNQGRDGGGIGGFFQSLVPFVLQFLPLL
ncbi:MAG: pentapeptide repeat-containing protein [Leptolyngbyaceae cyanobacterium bins.59]|nr:pentapeptide repeat-containing protein [Leptolyngbyaceae cyanobacterium bins.59]